MFFLKGKGGLQIKPAKIYHFTSFFSKSTVDGAVGGLGNSAVRHVALEVNDVRGASYKSRPMAAIRAEVNHRRQNTVTRPLA